MREAQDLTPASCMHSGTFSQSSTGMWTAANGRCIGNLCVKAADVSVVLYCLHYWPGLSKSASRVTDTIFSSYRHNP